MGLSRRDAEFVCVSCCFTYGGMIVGYGLGVSSILLVLLGAMIVLFGPLVVLEVFWRRYRVNMFYGGDKDVGRKENKKKV